MGLGFNEDTHSVAVLVQGKMAQLRSGQADIFDTFLLLIDSSGYAAKAVSITQGDQNYNMYSTANGVFGTGKTEDYYFAGYSEGFQTQYRQYLSGKDNWPETNNNYDTYVYKFNFNNAGATERCLY